MKLLKLLKALSLLSALLLPLSVNASALIPFSNVLVADANDGKITHDVISGLSWLDLTETTGMSYNEVSLELSDGRLFDGYRFATDIEVVALWAHGNVDLSSLYDTSNKYDDIVDVIGLLGNTYTGDNSRYGTLGLTYKKYNNDQEIFMSTQMGAFVNTSNREYNKYIIDDYRYNLDNVVSHTGTYLVSVVPVPAAVWLFGSAMVGLVGVSRRKKLQA